MKKLMSLITLSFVLVTGYAQKPESLESKSRLTGRVVDSLSSQPLEYATITLIRAEDGKTVNGGVSNNVGNFSINGIAPGKFKVTVESIGYKIFTVNNVVVTGKAENVVLKDIFLEKSTKTLEAITVTAGKLIENKIDKLVYNAEKDIGAQTGVATDILKKVPMVSVDVDGNVELAGSSSIRFLINGKPSTAFGNNISDVLQAIPASQIKSIEVITNPGAKYDAQGLGGIINIILKKSNVQGINNSLSLSAGTRMENGSYNFNAKKGKFGVNAFLSGNTRLKAKTPYTSEKLSYDSSSKSDLTIAQDGYSDITRHGVQSGIGFEAAAGEHNNFSGNISYNNFGFNGSGSFNQSQITSAPGDINTILSELITRNDNHNSFHEHNLDGNLNYKRTFKKEDQELEFNFNSSHGKNQNTSGNGQFIQPADSLIYGRDGKNNARETLNEFTIDYTEPFGEKIKWGIGTKLSLYKIQSDADVLSFQNDIKEFAYDSSQSVDMNYHQKVYAAYSELSFPVANFFTAKVGGRFERTIIDANYSNVDSMVHIPSYNTFVPSIYLSRQLTEKQTLKLSYSKRIERPDYGELNPFINTSDPNNISMGNPYLRPEIGHRIELGFNNEFGKLGSLMVTLFYRINKDDIQPFVKYYSSFPVGDTTYSNVYVTTRENIGIEKNSGMSIFGDLHFGSKLSVRSNLFFFYRHTINAIDPGYNSNSFNYRFNANLTYQFTKALVGELFGNFNSARHEAQGKYPSFTSYSMALRKLIWNKKGSIAITANNIFSEYVTQKMEIFGPGFTSTSTRKIPFRSIGINFTWRFGRLEFKKDKEEQSTNLNGPSE